MNLRSLLGLAATSLLMLARAATADETCLSPYMAKIVGQEDFVYVWTLGVELHRTLRSRSARGMG